MAGGSNNVARMSPRQRMINLMYIVLTAMLALNVSSDVLNGFSQVQDSIDRTNLNMTARNGIQFDYLKGLYEQNPAKAGQAYQRGSDLKRRSEDLYNQIENYKVLIARNADGEDADYRKLVNNDNLESSSVVMLNPTTMEGTKLRKVLGEYATFVSGLINDDDKRKAVIEMLATKDTPAPGTVTPLPWERRMFENMPAVAAVTLLTKLQNDIRQAESEALSSLITSVDIGDVRVNELNAYVIPNSNLIIRGGK